MENENMLDKMIGEEVFVISKPSEDEYDGYYIAPQPSRCEYRSAGGFFIYPLTLKFRQYCGVGFLGGGR